MCSVTEQVVYQKTTPSGTQPLHSKFTDYSTQNDWTELDYCKHLYGFDTIWLIQ